MEKPKSYHDLVIKDGKFIGEWERLYSEFDDPWMQSDQPNRYSRSAGITHLKRIKAKSILECGCGLGYYADWIHKETGVVPVGIDISENAINKAKELFPHLEFIQQDLLAALDAHQHVDAILFAEIMWYILPELPEVIEKLKTLYKGKHLVIIQVFYKGSQKYGTEYFTSMQELIDYMPFECVAQVEATSSADTTIETATLFKI